MKRLKLFTSILLASLLIFSGVAESKTLWGGRTATVGGGSRALDAIPIASIEDGDYAFVQKVAGSQEFYYYTFDSSATDAESDPDYVRPDDYGSGPGVWVRGLSPGDNNLTIPSGTVIQGGIHGLEYKQDTDADHDVEFQIGTAWDSTNNYELSLSTVMTKQIDAAWAIGDDAGGMATGSVGASTVYNLCMIRHDTTGASDFTYDVSSTCANSNIGGNYTYYRRIGFVRTDSSSNIIDFVYADDEMVFAKASDMAVNSAGAVPAAYTAVDISGWIPDINLVSHVMIGGQSSTAGQEIAISADGTNTHHAFAAVNSNNGDTQYQAWHKLIDSGVMPWVPLISTNIYWSHGGAGQNSNADLRLHAVRLRR